MSVNLSSYHIFYTVATEKSISKSAKVLFISQPAISNTIKKLEESLNTILFIRSSKGVILTNDGKMLFDHLSRAFSEINSAEHNLKLNSQLNAGHINIGVSTTLCKHALLPHLNDFIKENPNIQIKINCQSTNQTLLQIEDNSLDIGLVAKPRSTKGVCYTPLQKIEDTFVASPDYLKNYQLAFGTDFEHANVMMLDKTNLTRQFVDDFLVSNNIKFNNYLEVSTMDLLIEFAKIGLGIACVIKNFVKEEIEKGTLVEVPLISKKIPSREIGFAYKKSHLTYSAISTFLDSFD